MPEPAVDLRSFFIVSANILSGIGFCLNAFLFYLIMFKTSKKISDYKIVLFQNCFVDVLYNLVNDFVKGQTDYKNGAFYLVGSDWMKLLPYPYYPLMFSFYVFTLFYCVTSIPVQFVYRYFVICHGKTLSTLQYSGLLLASTIGAFSFAGFFGYVVWPDKVLHNAKAELLKDDIFYFRGIPVFLVAEIQRWPLRLCFAHGYFLVTVSYGIIIFTCLKVWKKLKIEEASFSPLTRKLHKQMTKTMILQATVPLIFVLIPIGIAITAAFALINVPGLGMIVNSICCWIPVANPLVTIISVKTYRKIVISYFKICARIRHRNSSITAASMLGASNVYSLQSSIP